MSLYEWKVSSFTIFTQTSNSKECLVFIILGAKTVIAVKTIDPMEKIGEIMN